MTFLATALSANGNSAASNIEPGLLGFLVVAALGVALVFLLRSMNKQFRKIGPKPEDEAAEVPASAAAEAAAAAADGEPQSAAEAPERAVGGKPAAS